MCWYMPIAFRSTNNIMPGIEINPIGMNFFSRSLSLSLHRLIECTNVLCKRWREINRATFFSLLHHRIAHQIWTDGFFIPMLLESSVVYAAALLLLLFFLHQADFLTHMKQLIVIGGCLLLWLSMMEHALRINMSISRIAKWRCL